MRILFLSDTHLGFDLPFRPRIKRRRRGPDFFDNFRRALEPAFKGEVDAAVHGGDLLYRSRVPARLVEMAMEPLREASGLGVPVYIIPGNHERGAIPRGLLALHPDIHVFDEPRTFILESGGVRAALSGFPCERDDVRSRFNELVRRTGWRRVEADVHLLCLHQCFEGAVVGPAGYTFRYGRDVVRAADLTGPFAAVLGGHIHRRQVLTTDLLGNPLATPVFYPGSTERTSFAEKDETKGYLILELGEGGLEGWRFHDLPTRPMVRLEVRADVPDVEKLATDTLRDIADLPEDSIVQIRIRGSLSKRVMAALGSPGFQSRIPGTMNLSFSLPSAGRPER